MSKKLFIHYQIRSLKGIKRFMLMIQYSYLYLVRFKQKKQSTFGDIIRHEQRKQEITVID